MTILFSKYTPNRKNGKGVGFSIGDVVTYRMRNGDTFKITIDSELMRHREHQEYTGYEAIFHDDGKRYFAVDEGIIDWDGKQ